MTKHAQSTEPLAVYLEVGQKRVFACALEWPGWCRSGKTEALALEALAAYAPRYAAVAHKADIPFPAPDEINFHVVERLPGTGTTDFGAPGEIASSDRNSLSADEAARQTALVRAAWKVFDKVAASAPAELRKGPRGGGRNRDKMIDHVLGAEAAYARNLGVKHRQPAHDDPAAIAALRDAIVSVLQAPANDAPPGSRGWPPPYAARRIAWHVLDHAWEMDDKSDSA